MKKRIIALALTLALIIGTLSTFVIMTGATSPTPELSIAYCNLSFRDSVCIKYALKSNVSDVKILIWTAPEAEYTVGTHDDEITEYYTEDIDGVSHMIFDYTELTAKQMTDVVYARAYAQVDGVDYYSEVNKYSILQYAYNKLGKTATASTDTELKEMLTHMLAYGAAAQKYLDDYKVDRLATADWYQVKVTAGVLDDSCTHGLYLPGDKVTMTAPTTDTNGATFAYWADSRNNKVATTATYELTVGSKNEVYTPVYVKYSSGLEFDSNGDGTCYVVGMGECTDTELLIPPVSPDNDTVIGVEGFAGEAITSVSFPSTIEDIARRAFNNCTSLTDVYYDGTEEEWNNKVSIAANNDSILNATMHFNEPTVESFTVTFVDHDGTVLKTETVESGKSAIAPADPERENYTFTGWDKPFDNIVGDLTVTATYEAIIVGDTYTVTFVDYDGSTVLGTATVVSGGTAKLPENPTRSGYVFSGWDGEYENITSNQTVQANYVSEDASNIFLIDSATASVGDTFTVQVNLTGTVKLLTFDMCLYYDASVLEVVSFDDQEVTINHLENEGMFVLNHSQDKNRTKEKYLTEITFKVKEGATVSSTEIYIGDAKDIVYVNDSGTYSDANYELIAGVVRIQ